MSLSLSLSTTKKRKATEEPKSEIKAEEKIDELANEGVIMVGATRAICHDGIDLRRLLKRYPNFKSFYDNKPVFKFFSMV